MRTHATATFTVTASVVSSVPKTIGYTMSGNAVRGGNYRLSGSFGQVTIPAGVKSATVTLTPIAVGTLSKTATMTLATGPGYTLSVSKSASVTITR